MKVCTDACLFGAWAAEQIENGKVEVNSILDIGTGTGLLSLMLAQKTKAAIDAVEVDEAAAEQAKENFEASPWRERLHLHQLTIQDFSNITPYQFDVIISNPPFFISSLKSGDKQKNLAKHNMSLSFEELAGIVSKLLNQHGVFYLLLPYQEFQQFVQAARHQDLFLQQQVHVQQTPAHAFFRTIGSFSFKQTHHVKTEHIVIRKENNEYSDRFTQLLIDYYLYL